MESLRAQLERLVADGGSMTASPVLTGITDLSVPILAAGSARAALTVPFVDGPAGGVTLAASQAVLRTATAMIAEQLAPVVRDGAGADRLEDLA